MYKVLLEGGSCFPCLGDSSVENLRREFGESDYVAFIKDSRRARESNPNTAVISQVQSVPNAIRQSDASRMSGKSG
jgi:hypothetical protein